MLKFRGTSRLHASTDNGDGSGDGDDDTVKGFSSSSLWMNEFMNERTNKQAKELMNKGMSNYTKQVFLQKLTVIQILKTFPAFIKP